MASNYVELGKVSSASFGYAVTGIDNLTSLAALSTADLSAGTVYRVNSVGDDYELRKSESYTADSITVVNATDTAANQWVRLGRPSRKWMLQSAWYIDPVSGSDEAAGSISAPIKTMGELDRRWGTGRILPQNTTVNILSAPGSSDPLTCNVRVGANVLLKFVGTTTTAYSGSITSVTQALSMGSNQPMQFQDTATTQTWTTWINNRINWKKVNGSNVSNTWAWVTKDIGSQTARPSTAITWSLSANISSVSDVQASLTTADTYDVVTLPIVYWGDVQIKGIDSNPTTNSALIVQDIAFGDVGSRSIMVTSGIDPSIRTAFVGCQFQTWSVGIETQSLFINCSTTSSCTNFQLCAGSNASLQGGWYKTGVIIRAGGLTSAFAPNTFLNTNVMLGSQLNIIAGCNVTIGGMAAFDVTTSTGAVLVGANSIAQLSNRLWGSGQTGVGLRTRPGARVTNATWSNITITGTGGDFSNGGNTNAAIAVVDPITNTLISVANAPTQSWANMTVNYNDAGGGGFQVTSGSSPTGATVSCFTNPFTGAYIGNSI